MWGFPGGWAVKSSPASVGDVGLIPGWGRSPGEGNGNAFQYLCLKNCMDRGAWCVTIHGVSGVGHDLATQQQKITQCTNLVVKLYSFLHLYTSAICHKQSYWQSEKLIRKSLGWQIRVHALV